MRCPLEGEIQAYIDDELDNTRSLKIKEHLSECSSCRDTFNSLIDIDSYVEEKIINYRNSIHESRNRIQRPINVSSEIKKIDLRRAGYNFMIKNKKVLASACAVLLLALCISVQPVRAAISSALSIFRVENVKSISLTLEDLSKIQREISSHKSYIDLDKLGNIKNSGGELSVITPAEALQIKDLKVQMPSTDLGLASRIETKNPGKVQFDLNIKDVNSLLTSLGADKLLPENLSGKTFSINVPRMVNIQYHGNKKDISIIETRTPELQVPEGVNVEEIYNTLTELPILPNNLKKQLKSIKDWKNTMYVPVVTSQMEEIEINGVKGYATDINVKPENIKDQHELSSYVIWFKDGVLYSIGGNVGRTKLINIAKSMR